MDYRIILLWVAVVGGCDGSGGQSADPSADVEVGDAAIEDAATEDAGPVDTLCTGSWRPAENGVTCEPPALRADCPPGSFALPDGTCSEVWACPEGWSRIVDAPADRPRLDIGCQPPPLREACPAGSFPLPDGTCTPVWACPEGWTRPVDAPPQDEDGNPTRARLDLGCEPDYNICTATKIPLAGGGCDDLGLADCGEDPWGGHDWPAGTRYVAADAPAEGADGTREHPYPTISEALAAAGDGGTVAVAAGDYAEPLTLPSNVRLGGRCADQVHLIGGLTIPEAGEVHVHDLSIDGADQRHAISLPAGAIRGERLHMTGATEAVVNVTGTGNATLEAVRVGPTEALGVRVMSGGTLECTRCLVDQATVVGMNFIQGGRGTLRQVVVRNTQPRASSGKLGQGLVVQNGAEVTLTDGLIEANHFLGVMVEGAGARLQAQRVVVQDTRPQRNDQLFGSGLSVGAGAQLTLTDVWVSANHAVGLYVNGGAVAAERLVVRDTRPRANDQGSGGGIFVVDGQVACTDVLVTANHTFGVATFGPNARLEAHRLVVLDTRPQANDDTDGHGLDTGLEAQIVLTDGLLSANRRSALILGEGATVEARRLTFSDTRSRASDQRGGFGVVAYPGGRLMLFDSALVNNRAIGLSVSGGVVEAERLTVRATRGQALNDLGGLGMDVVEGGHLTLTDALIEANQDVGLLIGEEGTQVEATRLVVRDNQNRGLHVQADARLTLHQALFQANREVGLIAREDATVEAQQVVVRDTRPHQAHGAGLVVQEHARLILTAALLATNEAVGLLVAGADTQAEAHNVVIRDTRPLAEASVGLQVRDEALLEATDLLVLANHHLGLGLTTGARATLTRAVVAETLAGTPGLGDGLGVLSDAHLTATDFILRDHPRHGLLLVDAEAELTSGLITGNTTGLAVRGSLTATRVVSLNNEVDEARCESEMACFEPPPAIEALPPLE